MPNNRFNLTCPLSRFVQHFPRGRSPVLEAQTAPIRFAERAAQVKRMLQRPGGARKIARQAREEAGCTIIGDFQTN